MPCTILFMAMLHVLLLLSPPMLVINNLSSRVCGATRRLDEKGTRGYVAFKPELGGNDVHPGVDNCMPKGFRRTSAPSRYINANTFGSNLCSSEKHETKH